VLPVTKPDRPARSTSELLAIEADLTQARHRPGHPEHGREKLDTRTPTSELMLTILAGVAAWEREIMLERQREGIAKAKPAGKYKAGHRASIGRRSGSCCRWAGRRRQDDGIARSTVYKLGSSD
jgi:DNA invertase Pin-like site-specific DNA recombinase